MGVGITLGSLQHHEYDQQVDGFLTIPAPDGLQPLHNPSPGRGREEGAWA